MLLRAEINADLKPLADWWTEFYEAEMTQREKLLKTMPKLTGFGEI